MPLKAKAGNRIVYAWNYRGEIFKDTKAHYNVIKDEKTCKEVDKLLDEMWKEIEELGLA